MRFSLIRIAALCLIVGVMFRCATLQAAEAPNKADDATAPNSLSAAEKQAGWKLLFDGHTLDGWHNFKSQEVRLGWQVKDGALACVDPHNAGDIVTEGKYRWFELKLEYNISE